MGDPADPQPGVPPRLAHDALVAAQRHTLSTPRRSYGIAARALFATMDLVYGRRRTMPKFKVLEIIARVPYQTWEHVAYIAITHMHRRTGMARRIHDRIVEARGQQDNELWHLLILQELIRRRGVRESRFLAFWLPQAIAFMYYQLSWLLFVVYPKWSYRLNADFEDHAEHEYMLFVDEHPEWETEPFDSEFAEEYGAFDSLADLFRQIGHDERVHKEESLAAMATARFR
jgi:demethoxyubiquinone hydroxylase (CLK1/Coq7/Cat5 family)